MRLIDADALIEILIDRDFIKTSRQEDNARELLNLAPTVDAVEVVRCKDCKKQSNLVCNYLEGLCALQSVKPNDFCSYGERKEE